VDEDGDVLDILVQSRRNRRAATSNKQLNFVQHVQSLLTIHGRAAVVVPDNALFEGGAGETVRKNLLKECDVHTLLRLPTGFFYVQGVKANVLFFDRKPGAKEPWTKTVWVYDLRTNKHFTLKTKRLTRVDLDEFVECYRPGDCHNRVGTWSEETPDGRWRPSSYDEIINRDKVSLDLSSGSATKVWRIRPTYPTRISWRRRSPTTSAQPLARSRTCSSTSKLDRPQPHITTKRHESTGRNLAGTLHRCRGPRPQVDN